MRVIIIAIAIICFSLLVESFAAPRVTLKSPGVRNRKTLIRSPKRELLEAKITNLNCQTTWETDIIAMNPVMENKKSLGRQMLDEYSNLLSKYPYTTKMATSGAIGALGDVFIQYVLNKKVDMRRLLVFVAVTTFYIGPIMHIWFGLLSKIPVPQSIRKSRVGNVLSMLLVDQTIGSTAITAGFFFAFAFANSVLPPYSLDAIPFHVTGLEAVKKNLWPTLIANWYCWPLINFANFLFVPLEFRVLFANVAAVFWNMYLSTVVNAK